MKHEKVKNKIDLTKIINNSDKVIEKQMGEKYLKYNLKNEFIWLKSTILEEFRNKKMFEIVKEWQVDKNEILLIEMFEEFSSYNATSFKNLKELEGRILSKSSFFNNYCTFILPIIYGEVRDFEIYDKTGKEILKYEIDYSKIDDYRKRYSLKWRNVLNEK